MFCLEQQLPICQIQIITSMSYRIAPLANATINLITLQSIIRHKLFDQLAATQSSTILTTVQYHTHLNCLAYLDRLKANTHIRFVPYYYPLVYIHNQQLNLPFLDPQTPRKISLLVGDNNPSFISQLNFNKIVTLEEVCSVFPQKVPLSYRGKSSQDTRHKLQTRLGIKTVGERLFQFEHMLMIDPTVRMWDEAIQVILDCLPTPLYVPYLKPSSSQEQFHRLTCDDFLSGLTTIHQAVSKALKSHPALNIVRFDQTKQLNWILSNVAQQASKMCIDRYFFSEQPRARLCGGGDRLLIVEDVSTVL